ncbi:MAG: type VI secretion system baseplate subunit TssG [Desulfovermiculus sp.]|nr:type VI secretion system baseplate subunit TssG [Desulfovermiculus sp.]
MAGPSRRSSTALEAELMHEAKGFSFFQAMRLLRIFESSERASGSWVRIRPELSLAFPASDIANIRSGDDPSPQYHMEVSFLGLYGASSPLPTFYTEDLLAEEAEEESVTRDFLDIFNQRIYELFFQCWSKYRQFIQIHEDKNEWATERLFSLIGLGEKESREILPESFQLIRYIGLFSQFPRSALGLKTLLGDALDIQTLDIEPCIPTWVTIPETQRTRPGLQSAKLGTDTVVGSQILDRMNNFRIHIGPLNKRTFQALMPGNPKYTLLMSLVRLYITDALAYDVSLSLKAGEAQKTCLGGAQWSILGLDTWIFSQPSIGQVQVSFQPEAVNQSSSIAGSGL